MYKEMLKKDPSRRLELQDMIFSFDNSIKAYRWNFRWIKRSCFDAKEKGF